MLQTIPETQDGRVFRLFCFIAGIDREALRQCPRSDRLLATHLGFSLLIAYSFMFLACCVSLSTTFAHDPFSSSLVIVVALLVAATISLLDRLFFQADWFAQAEWQSRKVVNWGRWLVVGVRIGLSVSIAFVVAGFIELFMFRSDIEQQIDRMHHRENSAHYEKIELRKNELDAELVTLRRELGDTEERLKRAQDKEVSVHDERNPPTEFDEEIAKEEENLRKRVSDEKGIRAEIARYERAKRAAPIDPYTRAPTPEYYRAVDNLRSAQTRLTRNLAERKAIEARLEDLKKAKRSVHVDDVTFARTGAEQARAERDAKRAKLEQAQQNRDKRLAEYTSFIMEQPSFVQTQKGLFAQVVAYDQLRESPAIWWKSFWTKLFIIFIEAAPVLAKILFAPSSVYAAVLASRVSNAILETNKEQLKEEEKIVDLEAVVAEKRRERERQDRAFRESWAQAAHQSAEGSA
jgi:phosphate/sulfate permease